MLTCVDSPACLRSCPMNLYPLRRWRVVLASLLAAMIFGSDWIPPGVMAVGGATSLLVLFLAARASLASDTPPPLHRIFLGLLCVVLLGLGLVTATLGSLLWPERVAYQHFRAEVAIYVAILWGLTFVPYGRAWAYLRSEERPGPRASEVLVPRPRWATLAIISVWFLVHATLWATYPPLVQVDSWCNVFLEPNLFAASKTQMHHLPLYSLVVKFFAWEKGALVVGLSIITAAQHLLVLAVAFTGDRLIRRVTNSPIAAALAAMAIVLDAQLASYAQMIMTEVLSLSLAVFVVASLLEALFSKRALAWICLGGVLAGLAILARQAFMLWVLLPALWLLVAGFKKRGFKFVIAFLVLAWAPLVLILIHNGYFYGRAQLTESGRFLVYRIAWTVPLPSEEEAARDPDKRALRLIVLEKERVWVGPYERLRSELGWSDEEYTRQVRRLWIQMALTRPRLLLRATTGDAWKTLRANGADLHLKTIAEAHNYYVPDGLGDWSQLPRADAPGALRTLWADWSISWLFPVLILSLLGLVPVPGRVRGTALLLFLSIAYLVFLPCLIVYQVGRFRVPAIPFLLLSAGLGLANCLALLRFTHGKVSGAPERVTASPSEAGPIAAIQPPTPEAGLQA